MRLICCNNIVIKSYHFTHDIDYMTILNALFDLTFRLKVIHVFQCLIFSLRWLPMNILIRKSIIITFFVCHQMIEHRYNWCHHFIYIMPCNNQTVDSIVTQAQSTTASLALAQDINQCVIPRINNQAVIQTVNVPNVFCDPFIPFYQPHICLYLVFWSNC